MAIDAQWMRNRLKDLGKSQAGLARALGVNPSQVTRMFQGHRELAATEAPVVADYFEVPLKTIIEKLDGTMSGSVNAALRTVTQKLPTREPPMAYKPIEMPRRAQDRDLPVMGLAASGRENWFEWNGEILDYVVRPAVLERVPNAYALFNQGTSMEPRYLEGDTLYIHPGRPITHNCFVVVQLRPARDGDAPTALIKQFVKRANGEVVLHQFNPPKDIKIPQDQVVSIHRIVQSGEA